jgi:hypothetical protein
MSLISRVFIAACLAIVSLSACGSKSVVVESGCKGLGITYDPSQSFLKIGVTSTQLHIAGDYHINGDISDRSAVLYPVALVSLPPIPYNAFMSLYNDNQETQDYSFNHQGRDFMIREVGAGKEPLFSMGSAVAGIMENTGKYSFIDLWFDGRAVNSSHFIGDKDHQVTIYLVAAKGKMDNFTCKSIDKVVLSKDNIKVIDE